MYQNKKLATLLVRNEDWLISKVLGATRDYNQPGFASLINHSWRQTIKEFSEAIILHSEKAEVYNHQSLLALLEKNDFTEFSKKEADRCIQRNLAPQIYLTFIKIIRKAYDELIIDSRLSPAEKKDNHVLVNKSFDCLEIAFIASYNDFETEKHIINRSGQHDSFFEILFENVAIPLLLLDPFHKIVNHNRAATKLFPFLFIGGNKQTKHQINFDDKDFINSKIDEFRISNHKEVFFETAIRLYNSQLHFMVNLRKLRETELILASFVDLSKWKELEKNLEISKVKAEDSDRLKTAFLANMSHEIRTPMNAIVGFAELLTMSNPNHDERIEYLTLIKKSSNDLLNIIEDIIDIAKIESKQLKVSPKNTNLYELLTELQTLYSEVLMKYGKDNVKIQIHVPEKEKKLALRTDPKRLKQVLSNLIGNAIKFTENGLIEIGFKVAEKKIVYFFVKDSGIGIPYNMQKRIFDQFVQVEEAAYKNTNGTGLGLAISKNIINLLGGNIWVASKPNKGSNFYFYLPYIQPSPISVHVSAEPSNIGKKVDLSSFCILIAEDEETNYLYLREALKSSGINIIWAKNGLEAINYAENNENIGLILMDIKMPEVSGLEASRYIKHIRPTLPIIAQTAFAMDTDKQACFDAGCVDFLPKPLTHHTLVSIIQKYLTKTGQEAINSSVV
jgi:signal transduction histidine kinase/CheY-like chemotaxis protein